MEIELNRTDFLVYTYQRLFKVYLLIIGMLTSFRLGFVAYYADQSIYQNYANDLVASFIMGWRYDTIVASYFIFIPFVLLNFSAILQSKKLFNFLSWVSGIYFFFVTIFIVLISVSDLGFYSFFQDHLNILFFGFFEDDTEALLKSIWKNYPLEYALIAIVVFLIFVIIYLKQNFKFLVKKQRSIVHGSFFKFVFITSIGVTLLVGGARGGYGMMVLSPKYADFSQSLFINQVALNGVITFEKAIKLRRTRSSLDFNMAKALGYGDNIHKAFSDYLGFDTEATEKKFLINLLERKTPFNASAQKIKPNIIVLVMESFGAHWIQFNSEQFDFLGPLKQHFDQDILFQNFLSSGNGTIGSLMVVGTNIPYRNGARFISESRYMQTPLDCAAHIPYKKSGYQTSFVYGGKLGWRDIGKYFTHQGYHFVEGEEHISQGLKLQGDQGTEWGLYDEHFFSHIYNKLQQAKSPQFIMGLSTSNHPPFAISKHFKAADLNIPKNLESKITREKELFLLRFKAFQYANYQLASFIQKIKDSNLADNTIIAVTGDHNFWGFMNYTQKETFSKYKVPLYLYIPDGLKPENINLNKFGSHEDIMTTLYNLSLSEQSYISFGEDLFGISNSIAINSDVFADNRGVLWKNKFYLWDKIPLIQATPVTNTVSSTKETKQNTLKTQAHSSIAVSDFYLRQMHKKAQKDKKNKNAH